MHTQKTPTRLATGTTANVKRARIHNYAEISALIYQILVRIEMPNNYRGILRTLFHSLTIRMVITCDHYPQGALLIGK